MWITLSSRTSTPATARRGKNSPSRWRFRPPTPRTFGLRLRPSGAASAYSRSVLGARDNLTAPSVVGKRTRVGTNAVCRHSCREEPSDLRPRGAGESPPRGEGRGTRRESRPPRRQGASRECARPPTLAIIDHSPSLMEGAGKANPRTLRQSPRRGFTPASGPVHDCLTRQAIQELAAAVGADHDVLDAHGEVPVPEDRRLVRERHARLEGRLVLG